MNYGKVKLMVRNIVHSRVYKISGDQFYALLSKQDDALFQLYKSLPIAIKDFLNNLPTIQNSKEDSILDEIKVRTKKSKRSIIDEISFENYSYYLGFDKL